MLMRDGDWLRYNAGFGDGSKDNGFKSVGKNVRIHCMSVIPNPENISIGDHVRIDAFTVLSAKEITIGSFVHIAAHAVMSGPEKVVFGDFSAMSHGAKIFTATDNLWVPGLTNSTVPDELHPLITGPVVIEPHAIVGAGSVVMPGVKMGMASVLGALSLLKQSCLPYSIVAGVPARFIRERVKGIDGEALEELERRCRDSQ
jgi:acetyltransferase-like isoleucine patch superfamily enzyme